MEMQFYGIGKVDDSQIEFVLIAAQYKDKWIFCKNKTRKWELPGGHREKGESALEAAKRELFEETGAREFTIKPVYICFTDCFGMVFHADIIKLDSLPPFEIERIDFFEELPKDLSFPQLTPTQLEQVKVTLGI